MMLRQPPVPTVDVSSIPAGAYLLDVREADEWAAGHAGEAVHLPLGDVLGRIEEIPADRDVYVICKVGGRSAQAVQALLHHGRSAVNVAGGMLAWEAAGRPLVSDATTPPYVA